MQQQLLLERKLSRSSSSGPLPYLTSTPPAALPLNGLRRGTSLSPGAKNFVFHTATSYGTKLVRKKALLVGIGYRNHKHLTPLRGCKNDVLQMFALLSSELFGFPERNIRVLCDELSQLGTVRVGSPTRTNILRDMKWLTEGVVAGDSVFFFFAGHGERVQDTSGDEKDTGFDQCIMPIDFMRICEPIYRDGKIRLRGVDPILDDTIYERLVRSVPDGAKVTAVVDACKSGTICDLPVIYDEHGSPRYRNGERGPPREVLRPYLAAGGCVLFSGSADHQLSADMTVTVDRSGNATPEKESFGIMTRSFVEASREMCTARSSDYDGVENWSYGELLERIRQLVKEKAHVHMPAYFEKQEPQLSSSHAFDIWNTKFAV